MYRLHHGSLDHFCRTAFDRRIRTAAPDRDPKHNDDTERNVRRGHGTAIGDTNYDDAYDHSKRHSLSRRGCRSWR
jgi:hypothetical protein